MKPRVNCMMQLSKELQKLELEENAENEESQFRDYPKYLNALVDFSAIIKDKSPDEIINAIKTVVDRIYVVRSGEGGKVNVFLKGEDIDYERFFEQSGTGQEGAFSCDPDQVERVIFNVFKDEDKEYYEEELF